MLFRSVYDAQNRRIGSVKDLILDRGGQVSAVVLDVGTVLGIGGKYVAVSLNAIEADNDRLTLNMTKEQIQQARAYQMENPDTGAGTSNSPVPGGHLGAGAGTSTVTSDTAATPRP